MAVPLGYCTIPEALTKIEANGKALTHLQAAILNGELRIFVQQSKGKYDVEICRVPLEDLRALSDTNWVAWLPSGRVPKPTPEPPDPAYEAARQAWYKDPSSFIRVMGKT